MKIHRRIISAILALALCMGAIFYVSAAKQEVAILSAKTGLEPVGNVSYNSELPVTMTDLPESYNSADYGYTLPVRQQHDNTCWAFGTLSTFETLLLKNGENIETFAPQHTNYWGAKREDGTGWQRDSHSGGYSYIPLGYLMSWAGPVYESEFPELTSTEEDYKNLTATPRFGLNEAVYFNNDADRDAIKELIYKYGAVVGSFNSDLRYLTDNTAFYCADDTITIGGLQGHCVSVVGWDDSYAKENFSDSLSGIPQNDGAWLIKNSWSDDINSIGGYFWISYEDVWVFDDIFGPSYALTSYEKITDNVKLYQNEVDGATYEFSYLTSEASFPYCDIVYMNAFDFTEEHRNIDEVIFESTSLGAEYKIYYIPFDGDAPTIETSLWTELYSGVITYTGYICADVEDMELPVGKGCIGVSIDNEKTYLENKDNPDYTYIPNSIGVSEWLHSNGKYIFYPQADYGMSYYMYNDGKREYVADIMEFYDRFLNDDIGGTFVIKAITRNESTEPEPTVPDPTEPTTTVPDTIPTEPTTAQTEPTTTVTAPSSLATVPTSSETTSVPTSTASTAGSTTSTAAEATTVPIDEPFIYKLGDADLNDKVNVRDATQIQKSAALLITLSDREKMAADVNSNNTVNVVDSTIIQKFVANMEVNYKVGQTIVYFE